MRSRRFVFMSLVLIVVIALLLPWSMRLFDMWVRYAEWVVGHK